MAYVDGFVIPVRKDKLDEYTRLATLCAQVWKEHGALTSVECVGDDVPYGTLTSFPRAVQAKDDEVVILAWVVHPSRESREACNKKAMEDPRMKRWENAIPFDGKRMIFGGFTPFQGL